MSSNNEDDIELNIYEIVPGYRKNSKLLLIKSEQQLYKYKYEKNNTKYYVCYNSTCPVNVAVDFNNPTMCRKTKKNIQHNHSGQEELLIKLKLINTIKTSCENVSLKRSNVRDIFDETCKQFKPETSASIEFGKMRRNLHSIKSRIFPKSPQNFQDISNIFKKKEIFDEFGKSRHQKDKDFYRHTIIEANFAYTIFMSPTIHNTISGWDDLQPRHFLMDGTFAITPCGGIFKQLIIIHIAHSDYVSI